MVTRSAKAKMPQCRARSARLIEQPIRKSDEDERTEKFEREAQPRQAAGASGCAAEWLPWLVSH
jgi:hypothetical protein